MKEESKMSVTFEALKPMIDDVDAAAAEETLRAGFKVNRSDILRKIIQEWRERRSAIGKQLGRNKIVAANLKK